ncbi:hypothetical protein Salat_1189100 [Sesamum alatum]|uniref:Uncharacterized protein n=1 Tax=Sesamum alatum TaxID=300844 RepID=A0AAE1YF40_9LAMI|nr:hypothetical protein Salat_1189100 [Sesamum alatum]
MEAARGGGDSGVRFICQLSERENMKDRCKGGGKELRNPLGSTMVDPAAANPLGQVSGLLALTPCSTLSSLVSGKSSSANGGQTKTYAIMPVDFRVGVALGSRNSWSDTLFAISSLGKRCSEMEMWAND